MEITSIDSTKYFIELYITALRAFYNNDFLQAPKEGSEKYDQLDQARKLVDKVNGEYSDYIRYQFDVFRKYRTTPKPGHLITPNAVKRYRAYQRKYNKFWTKEYTVNGEHFTVNETRETFPESYVSAPVHQDATALHAYHMVEVEIDKGLPEEERDRALNEIKYLIAKLKYKGVIIPQKVLDVLEKINRN